MENVSALIDTRQSHCSTFNKIHFRQKSRLNCSHSFLGESPICRDLSRDPDLAEKRDSHEEAGAIGDAVLVDARHVDSEAVFEAATDHQA